MCSYVRFESCITCSITIWFMAAPKKETVSLTRADRTASYIIGKELNGLDMIYQRRIVSHVTKIMTDELYPLTNSLKCYHREEDYHPFKQTLIA